jgi:hypothetical protein
MLASAAESILWGVQPGRLFKHWKVECDPWQWDLANDTSARIIVVASRQIGKTFTIATKVLGRFFAYTNQLILILAPTLRQSVELMSKIQGMYKMIPGAPDLRFKTLSMTDDRSGNRIVALPGGNPDNVRGFSGPTCIVCDEAAFMRDKLYNTLRPMLMTSKGQLILISTPFWTSGFFYRIFTDTNESLGEEWSRYHVPATECPRVPQAFLDAELRALGPWWFNSEYMGVFQDPQNSLFHASDIDKAISQSLYPMFEAVPGFESNRHVQSLFGPEDL